MPFVISYQLLVSVLFNSFANYSEPVINNFFRLLFFAFGVGYIIGIQQQKQCFCYDKLKYFIFQLYHFFLFLLQSKDNRFALTLLFVVTFYFCFFWFSLFSCFLLSCCIIASCCIAFVIVAIASAFILPLVMLLTLQSFTRQNSV